MKKIIILSLFLVVVASSFAKDISIRVVNENEFPITIMFGVISSKDNAYSDDEIVQNSKTLKIAAIGRALAANKKTQFNKTDLSGSSIVVVFGMCQGGGRTNVYRYKVKDIKEELALTFEKVKIYKSNSSYIKIAEGLKKTEDIGSYFSCKSNQIIGSFIFFNITSDKLKDVFLAIQPAGVEIETGKKTNNTVNDFLTKTAVIPFISVKGELARAVPPNTTDVYNEVVIPGLEKSAEIFGENNNRFLTWNITGSARVIAKYKDKSYLSLYSSCIESERKNIMNKFLADLNESGTSDDHLYFIINVHQTDNIEIIDEGMKKIEDYELILENDLMSANGNFHPDGSKKTVVKGDNIINDVIAIDVTPLLYYMSIVQGWYSNTSASATNCAGIYKELGSFIELPELDEKTISIVSPQGTISKIKELINDPKILASIETKLLTQTPASISMNAVKIAQIKLDSKKK